MIILSDVISQKLRIKHNLTAPLSEITQAFANRTGNFLKDNREQHKTEPPTLWFIAETDFGRKLKVCFIEKEGKIFIRTAYYANNQEIRIYEKYK